MKSLLAYTDMLAQLVALPSVSSADPRLDQGNRAVIECLASFLADEGFAVEIMPLPGENGKANLIATRGQGAGGLILSGHSDTVPCDAHLWQSDPFQLIQKDQRLYGLGATDMKGFFPLVIEALKTFRAVDFKQPLIVVATANEETSMSGARALLAQGRPKSRFALIGEPTSLRPIRLHKGITMETIRLQGRSGHSSNPALGVNALDAMSKVLTNILEWRNELATRKNNRLFVVPHTTVNLGCIHGGDNANRICGSCELHIDIRPVPGMSLEELRAELKARLLPLAETEGVLLQMESLFPGIPAFETPENSELVRLAEKLTGHRAEAVSFGTEAPFLQALGCETLILGPGNIDQAHQANEYIELDQVSRGITLLQQCIQTLCVEPR